MTLWIFATATAFSVQVVQLRLGSVRIESLPALQPAEQRRQLAVVSLQSSPPLFAVHGAFGHRHVAGKAQTTSAAAWLVPSALLVAALISRVARTNSESSGKKIHFSSSTLNKSLHYAPIQYARLPRITARRSREAMMRFTEEISTSIQISRSAESCYAAYSQLDRIPEWCTLLGKINIVSSTRAEWSPKLPFGLRKVPVG